MQNTRSLGYVPRATNGSRRMLVIQSFGTEKYACAMAIGCCYYYYYCYYFIFSSKYRVKLGPVLVMQISFQHFKCLHPQAQGLRNDPGGHTGRSFTTSKMIKYRLFVIPRDKYVISFHPFFINYYYTSC